MSTKEIDELQKELGKINDTMIEVEERASQEFMDWYKLHERRNQVIEKLRGVIRQTPFEGKSFNYGMFRVTRAVRREVDISELRKKVPEAFILPGVVTKVDVKALESAIASGDIDKEKAEMIRGCFSEEEDTPRIHGPKIVDL